MYIEPYQAIISSKGIEELCAFVEKVESSRRNLTLLSNTGFEKLSILLNALDSEDRVNLLGRFHHKASSFLNKHYKKRCRTNHLS